MPHFSTSLKAESTALIKWSGGDSTIEKQTAFYLYLELCLTVRAATEGCEALPVSLPLCVLVLCTGLLLQLLEWYCN